MDGRDLHLRRGQARAARSSLRGAPSAALAAALLAVVLGAMGCDGGGGGPDAGADGSVDAGSDADRDGEADGSGDGGADGSADADADADADHVVAESPVTPLPLAGELADDDAEVSGVAWYGDHLILLPQYPRRFTDGTHGALFALGRDEIVAFLDGSTTDPLEPARIPFDDVALDVTLEVELFEGFEAIAFAGEQAYLAIEAYTGEGHAGFLATGTIDPALAVLEVSDSVPAPIPSQSGLTNMADEAIVLTDGGVLTLHEANGVGVNASPVAHVFDESLGPEGVIPFPSIEYRVTDATDLDGEGRFWVINYFFTGDVLLRPASDPLADLYGEGPTHAEHDHVERLVELRYEPSGITLAGTPPIQLELTSEARNWEGLARLGDEGFLIITDEHPDTILAYVPAAEGGSF